MRKSFICCLILLLSISCINRLDFAPDAIGQQTMIVDGYVSDQPGPYWVKLSFVSGVNDDLTNSKPISARQVTLFDDAGGSAIMRNQGDGIYQTDQADMRGTIGRKYHIQIEMAEGTVFESEPDELMPGGQIDKLYYSFESFKPQIGPTRYGFRVFIDAQSPPTDGYIRWRYSGTFSFLTFPELNRKLCNCCMEPGPPAPLPCSGFVWTGSILQNVGPCTCCITYVTEAEDKPHLNDNTIATNGTYNKIEMGFANFDEVTFSRNKYMLMVEQMSLSREAYEYWKVFRDQKEGATSLFQPAFGKARTNIFSTNSNAVAGGFFYATALQKKVVFITSSDATVSVPPPDIDPPEGNCALFNTGAGLFLNTSFDPPPEWN